MKQKVACCRSLISKISRHCILCGLASIISDKEYIYNYVYSVFGGACGNTSNDKNVSQYAC